MELDLGPEIAQFRAELRDWIAAEAPGALAGLIDWNMPLTAGGRRGARLAAAEAHPADPHRAVTPTRPRLERAFGSALHSIRAASAKTAGGSASGSSSVVRWWKIVPGVGTTLLGDSAFTAMLSS